MKIDKFTAATFSESWNSQAGRGVNPEGVGGRDPQDLGKGSWGVAGGSWESWTGREILDLLYVIMYRKYVQKRCLLKRNRIICPEVAVNEEFLHGKLNFFTHCQKKSKFFKFA